MPEAVDVNSLIEVVEVCGDGKTARKMRCRLCGEICFEISRLAGESEFRSELVRLRAHFSINHDAEIALRECSDPECCK